MKREKTKLENIGDELVTLAKCIQYFSKRGKTSISGTLRPELIPILISCGYKVTKISDGSLEISWGNHL